MVLENTHNLGGGTVQRVDEVEAVVAAARESGFRVHVDGARIWNAAVALGVPPAALVEGADTVMVCLSKGCARRSARPRVPAPSSRRRAWRSSSAAACVSGGPRAAGLVALETMFERLADDHANAHLLAAALAVGRARGAPPVRRHRGGGSPGPRSAGVVARSGGEGALASAMDGRTVRGVTHRDLSPARTASGRRPRSSASSPKSREPRQANRLDPSSPRAARRGRCVLVLSAAPAGPRPPPSVARAARRRRR